MKCEHNESLGRMIYVSAQDIKNFAEKILKPYSLTLEQFHLLKNMSAEKGLSQRELGELVTKTPANITRILDRLEAKSLVSRQENPEDRRASLVILTQEGLKLVQEVFTTFESFSSSLTRGISEQEQQLTREVLGKLSMNLQKMSRELSSG